jgi:hypothetical protein
MNGMFYIPTKLSYHIFIRKRLEGRKTTTNKCIQQEKQEYKLSAD